MEVKRRSPVTYVVVVVSVCALFTASPLSSLTSDRAWAAQADAESADARELIAGANF